MTVSNIMSKPLYDCTIQELEALLIFWIFVARNSAKNARPRWRKFMTEVQKCGYYYPFTNIKSMGYDKVEECMSTLGLGLWKMKAKSVWSAANSTINIKTATPDELETIHGVGRKTSRCFILYSRPNAQVAGLDTHVLKWMRAIGFKDIPTATPTKKRYLELEKQFLLLAKDFGVTPAELDHKVWMFYAKETDKIQLERR